LGEYAAKKFVEEGIYTIIGKCAFVQPLTLQMHNMHHASRITPPRITRNPHHPITHHSSLITHHSSHITVVICLSLF
jgi:hypothetical protein